MEMAAPATQIIELRSVNELRSVAAEWDDLWRRSESTLPLGRAEIVADWIERVAPWAKFRVVIVEDDRRFVAALPLVSGRLKKLVPIARLPWSNWSWAGDLLLDPAIDDAAFEALTRAISRIRVPLVWLDAVPFESPRWRRLAEGAKAIGLSVHTRESFRVGRIEINHDWPAYERNWSKSHRRQIRRIEQLAEEQGGATLVVLRGLRPEEVEPLVSRGFQVEDASWKGRAGSSVIKSPAALALYIEQARRIAGWGDLQLTFLELAGRPMAFEYGWNAKGVYHSYKVGYDEAFARLSPGQLLRHRLLKQFYADPEQTAVDFLGPVTAATGHWTTSTYAVGRLAIATRSLAGRLVLHAYRNWRPRRTPLTPGPSPSRGDG